MNNKSNKLLLEIIIALLLIIIVAGGVVVYGIVKNNQRIASEQENGQFSTIKQDPNVVLNMDEKSYNDMMAEMQRKVDKGRVNVKFQNQILVPSNSKAGKVLIANPTTNNYDVFITIFLDSTQEQICQTGIIPLGGALEEVTLDKVLEDGDYTGVMVYNMIDENKKVVEQANLGIQIKVGD